MSEGIDTFVYNKLEDDFVGIVSGRVYTYYPDILEERGGANCVALDVRPEVAQKVFDDIHADGIFSDMKEDNFSGQCECYVRLNFVSFKVAISEPSGIIVSYATIGWDVGVAYESSLRVDTVYSDLMRQIFVPHFVLNLIFLFLFALNTKLFVQTEFTKFNRYKKWKMINITNVLTPVELERREKYRPEWIRNLD